MSYRKKHSQIVSAAKAGISERSARRIDHGQRAPTTPKREWRTRQDPLEPAWEPIVVPLLKSDESITPFAIYDYLCEHHQSKFSTRSRRTLERRIRHWRHLNDAGLDVMFLQTHEYGVLAIADFTVVESPVTIKGEALKHSLFHLRLPASGWTYVQVTYGGESFAAFSDGVQNAFRAAGGVTKQLRTDSLSAAYKNRSEQDDFTERFSQLQSDYGFAATRNNRGVAHENGAIEKPNGHLKLQLDQALKIRGSYDFDCRAAYQAFVSEIVQRRNRRVRDAFLIEQRQLHALPLYMSVNYSEDYVTVSRTSTICVKRVTYTVPSRLVGSRLLVHIYDAKLELFMSGQHILTLERVFARKGCRARSVDYRHVIDALVKKPRAFRHSQLRDELLPNDHYRTIWQRAERQLSADAACYYIVSLLKLAKDSGCEQALAAFVLGRSTDSELPSITACNDRFFKQKQSSVPMLSVAQHPLQIYSSLLTGGLNG